MSKQLSFGGVLGSELTQVVRGKVRMKLRSPLTLGPTAWASRGWVKGLEMDDSPCVPCNTVGQSRD